MAISKDMLEKIKAKMEAAKEGRSTITKELNPAIFDFQGGIKQDDGDFYSELRVLPVGVDEAFKEVNVHYNFGKEPFICPKRQFGEECLACDFGKVLWSQFNELGGDKNGSPAEKAAFKEAKGSYPATRFASPVVRRKDGETIGEPQWVSYNKTTYLEFMSYLVNPKIGDFTDAEAGRDLTITYTPKAKSSTDYAQINFALDPAGSTCLTNDKKKLKSLIDAIPDISEVYPLLSQEEIENVINNYVDYKTGSTGFSESKYGAKTDDTSVDDETSSSDEELDPVDAEMKALLES